MLWALLLMQDVQIPLPRRPVQPDAAPDAASLSIVVADTVEQVDPQPLCPEWTCTKMFLGTFRNARTYVGPPLPTAFAARQEMGSPYIEPYRLALIVERRKDQSLLIRATGGFNPRTKRACFETEDTAPLSWEPVAPKVSHDGPRLCVSE